MPTAQADIQRFSRRSVAMCHWQPPLHLPGWSCRLFVLRCDRSSKRGGLLGQLLSPCHALAFECKRAAGGPWALSACSSRSSVLIENSPARTAAAEAARALRAGGMAPKKAEPLAGQRSIAAFFSAKPKPAAEVSSCLALQAGALHWRALGRWAASVPPQHDLCIAQQRRSSPTPLRCSPAAGRRRERRQAAQASCRGGCGSRQGCCGSGSGDGATGASSSRAALTACRQGSNRDGGRGALCCRQGCESVLAGRAALVQWRHHRQARLTGYRYKRQRSTWFDEMSAAMIGGGSWVCMRRATGPTDPQPNVCALLDLLLPRLCRCRCMALPPKTLPINSLCACRVQPRQRQGAGAVRGWG